MSFVRSMAEGLDTAAKMPTIKAKKDICMEFLVTVDRNEAGGWLAACPAIPGCACRGATRDQMFAGMKNSIRACLEIRAGRELAMTVELLPLYMTAQRKGSKVTWTGEKERIEALIRNGSETGAVDVPKAAMECLGRFRSSLNCFNSRTARLNALCRRRHSQLMGGGRSDSGHLRRM